MNDDTMLCTMLAKPASGGIWGAAPFPAAACKAHTHYIYACDIRINAQDTGELGQQPFVMCWFLYGEFLQYCRCVIKEVDSTRRGCTPILLLSLPVCDGSTAISAWELWRMHTSHIYRNSCIILPVQGSRPGLYLRPVSVQSGGNDTARRHPQEPHASGS